MQVGLLICDHVKEEFRSIDGEYLDMFRKLLHKLILVPYFVCDNEFPASIDSHDAYLCTGSSHSVYEDLDWIENLSTFIRKAYSQRKKFVGICFGHQMIAHALGGEVGKAESGWCIGIHSFDIFGQKEWLRSDKEQFNVLMLCQDQVIELPEKSQILASSDDCDIGMYQVGESILGIQGHPEFSKEYNKTVYESRSDRIESTKIHLANEHMNRSPDTGMIASWIMRFLSNIHAT